MRALRFGLFGTGYWATETYAPALGAHPAVELVGVWGRDPARADALARPFAARGYPDADELIADVDAIAVALPPDVQAGIAVRAARAGRHLLLDKPLAFTTGAAELIVAEAGRRWLSSVVFFTNRFVPAIEAFLGRAAATEGWHGARAELLASIFQPGNPYGASAWRRERGGLWDVGPHALSLVLPVLGTVERVTALAGPRATTHALLGHIGGAVSDLTLSLDAAPAATRDETTFFGEPGSATVPARDCSVLAALSSAVDQLVAAAAGSGAPPVCDVRFGLEVVTVLAAVEAAVHSGRTITL